MKNETQNNSIGFGILSDNLTKIKEKVKNLYNNFVKKIEESSELIELETTFVTELCNIAKNHIIQFKDHKIYNSISRIDVTKDTSLYLIQKQKNTVEILGQSSKAIEMYPFGQYYSYFQEKIKKQKNKTSNNTNNIILNTNINKVVHNNTSDTNTSQPILVSATPIETTKVEYKSFYGIFKKDYQTIQTELNNKKIEIKHSSDTEEQKKILNIIAKYVRIFYDCDFNTDHSKFMLESIITKKKVTAFQLSYNPNISIVITEKKEVKKFLHTGTSFHSSYKDIKYKLVKSKQFNSIEELLKEIENNTINFVKPSQHYDQNNGISLQVDIPKGVISEHGNIQDTEKKQQSNNPKNPKKSEDCGQKESPKRSKWVTRLCLLAAFGGASYYGTTLLKIVGCTELSNQIESAVSKMTEYPIKCVTNILKTFKDLDANKSF